MVRLTEVAHHNHPKSTARALEQPKSTSVPLSEDMRPTKCQKITITANDVGKEYVMGNIKQASKRPMRKATFTPVEGEYSPVNKRAKAWASTLIGEQASYTKRDLKKIATKGKVRVYIYTKAGLRKVA
jgi:hypothetical protein